MKSTQKKLPAKRRRIERHKKTEIPQETMLQVLLWLDRFDLDRNQFAARRLRSLVERNHMPLRKVDRANYHGEVRDDDEQEVRSAMLSIHLEKVGPAKVEHRIETYVDVQKAASYLSSCFVRDFSVIGHQGDPPKNALLAAPALIRNLRFEFCGFDNVEEDTLTETLNGSTFQCLSLVDSRFPDWQIDNKRLESLRLRGCNEIRWGPDMEPYGDEKFNVTEAGILDYCFTLDDHLPVPQSRVLRITWATVTPAFFNKVLETSRNSQLTCDVELRLEGLRFDVGNLDVGVLPSRSQEHDRLTEAYWHNVRYNFADHGNGLRLLIHFYSFKDDEKWSVVVRHGKKDHEEFFGPLEEDEEEEPDDEDEEDEESDEHDSQLKDPDFRPGRMKLTRGSY